MYKYQRIGIAAYCFALNFDSYSLLGGGGLSIPKVVAVLYFMTVVFSTNFSLSLGRHTKLFAALVSVFLLITLSTYAHADDVSVFALKIFAMFLNSIMFFALLKHSQRDPEAIHFGILAFTVGAILTSAMTLIGYGIETSSEGRVTMFGDNENAFGLRLAVACIVMSTLALEANHKIFGWRSIFIVSSILPAMVVLKTGSRVAAISLFLALFVMLFNFRALSWKKLIIILFGIASAPFLYAYLETTPVFERLLRTYHTGDLAGRDKIWEDLQPVMFASPIIGSGFSAFSTRYGQFTSPHNVFIEVLIASGVIGLAFYLYYCWYIFRAGWYCIFVLRISLPAILLIPFLGGLLSGHTLDVKLFYLLHVYVLTIVYKPRPNSAPSRVQSRWDLESQGMKTA